MNEIKREQINTDKLIEDRLYVSLSLSSRGNMYLTLADEEEQTNNMSFTNVEYDDYEGCGHFEIIVRTIDGEDVCVCNGFYIDEEFALQDEYTLSEIADFNDDDTVQAFYIMENTKSFIPFEDEPLCIFGRPGSIYINRMFINPKYRQKNIASLIFSNIAQMFEHQYDISLRYACIIVSQDKQDLMPKEKMEKIMIRTLTKNGFRKHAKDGQIVYVKSFRSRYK